MQPPNDIRTTATDFESMLQRRQRDLWRLCLRQAWGDTEQARDLMQESLLALLRADGSRRTDVSDTEERSWVLLVARTALHNLRRKHRVETVPLDEIWQMADDVGDDKACELLDELRVHLSEADQQLLQLYRDGFGEKDIAAVLSISADAAGVRLHRLTERLRKIYDDTNKSR